MMQSCREVYLTRQETGRQLGRDKGDNVTSLFVLVKARVVFILVSLGDKE
jgi:hypothetical protein